MTKKEIVTFDQPNGIIAVHGDKLKQVALAVKEASGAGGMQMSDLERIVVPTGGVTSWTVNTINGEESRKEIFAAIVDNTETRGYWEQSFDEEPNQPPVCFSQDCITGISESEALGGDCGKCPMDQWGSAAKGNGKACKQRRIFLLITPDSALPVVLSIPSTSLKTVRKDFIRASGFGFRLSESMWKFTLTQEKSNDGIKYSVANATFVRGLTEEELTLATEFRAAVSSLSADKTAVE